MKLNIKSQFQRIFFILALTIMMAMPIFVSANTKAGLTLNSPFYFIDTVFEKITLFFTFNAEKKIQKIISYAEERLAEVEELAGENKPDLVIKTISKYEENINLAKNKISDIQDKEKAKKLQEFISEKLSKYQEALVDIRDKASDESKKGVGKILDGNLEIQERVSAEIAGLKSEAEDLRQRLLELEQRPEQNKNGSSNEQIKNLQKEIEALKNRESLLNQTKTIEIPTIPEKGKSAELTNAEIISKIKPAVVYIKTIKGSGSGMIIESDGLILTNAHVVEGVDSANIRLSDGRLFAGSVIGRDEIIDLALLRINGINLPIVELGNSDENILKQGDEAFTLGYPFGLEGDVSFKEGTISRRISDQGAVYLETSAESHIGNSGGPLVNGRGQVVGINTSIYGLNIKGFQLGEGIKFAIPINTAKNLMPELKNGRNITRPKVESQGSSQADDSTNQQAAYRKNRALTILSIFIEKGEELRSQHSSYLAGLNKIYNEMSGPAFSDQLSMAFREYTMSEYNRWNNSLVIAGTLLDEARGLKSDIEKSGYYLGDPESLNEFVAAVNIAITNLQSAMASYNQRFNSYVYVKSRSVSLPTSTPIPAPTPTPISESTPAPQLQFVPTPTSTSTHTPEPAQTPLIEKTITLWDNHNVTSDETSAMPVDVIGYKTITLNFSWAGELKHACQYRALGAGRSSYYYFDGAQSCNSSVTLPIESGANQVIISAWTSSNGILNGTLILHP